MVDNICVFAVVVVQNFPSFRWVSSFYYNSFLYMPINPLSIEVLKKVKKC